MTQRRIGNLESTSDSNVMDIDRLYTYTEDANRIAKWYDTNNECCIIEEHAAWEPKEPLERLALAQNAERYHAMHWLLTM